MTDENKLIRDAGTAVRARQLLEDELLSDGFQVLEAAYIKAWRSTTIEDVAGREKLFLAINIVAKVRKHLEIAVTDGKLAAAELKDIADAAARKRRFGII